MIRDKLLNVVERNVDSRVGLNLFSDHPLLKFWVDQARVNFL